MKPNNKINLICILGPTASGKTSFAARLAYDIESEIISADSRQVYRGMDIGTGKDYDDYIVNGSKIPSHMIDIIDAGEEYNVFEYQKDFYKVFEELTGRNVLPILCGGTGLYIEAVLKNYRLLQAPLNEVLRAELDALSTEALSERLKTYKNVHNTTDSIIRKRVIRAIEIEEYLLLQGETALPSPEIKPVIIGLDIDRDKRREKITQRLKQRMDAGMIDEARELLKRGVTADKLEFYGLEYKFLSRYIEGRIGYDEMFSSLNIAIHQFAKRQMTWFRKMEKEGAEIHWIDSVLEMDEKIEIAKSILESSGFKTN